MNDTDLSRLRGEYTFGLNRAYLLFDTLGFTTTFLVCVNRLVIEQCATDLLAIDTQRFLPWAARDLVPVDNRTNLLRSIRRRAFSTNASRGVWEGSTVTFVAMQLAYWMGFNAVVLVGVDHKFTTKGEPHTAIVSRGADPNHFDPNYFGAGFRWQLPDLETSEVAYQMARETFAADGRFISDATVGGQLDVFPKIEYDSLF